jgi:hypothetical protein
MSFMLCHTSRSSARTDKEQNIMNTVYDLMRHHTALVGHGWQSDELSVAAAFQP